MSTLASTHDRLGATFAPYRGVEAVADYGDAADEHRALREACGVIDRSWTGRLEMRGEDRARFLGGLVTCDVTSLAPGEGAYGFLTTVKGRVMADVTVLALDDRLWLELPPGSSDAIGEHLGKYVIVDRVEIAPLAQVPLTLIGPRAAEVLATAELPEGLHEHRALTLDDVETRVVREPPLGGSESASWSLWVAGEHAAALFEHLLQRGAGHGLRPVGHRAFDRWRIESGRPLFGVDFGPDNFPQETGLEEQAVSYTKGCYLGQEVVARIHYRGGVNRHLRGLIFDDGRPVDERVGVAVVADDREAGTVTSAAEAADGRRLGLAILHRRAEPDATVTLAGGGTARVVELPFAGPADDE